MVAGHRTMFLLLLLGIASGCSNSTSPDFPGDRQSLPADAWFFQEPGDSDWIVVVFAKWIAYYFVRHPLGLLINVAFAARAAWSIYQGESRLSPEMRLPASHSLKTYAAVSAVGVVCSVLFGSLRVLAGFATVALAALGLAMLGGGAAPVRRWEWIDTRTGRSLGPDEERNRMEMKSEAGAVQGKVISNDYLSRELTMVYAAFVTLGLLSHLCLFDGWLLGPPHAG
jgi:hypothetical protein